MKVSELRCFNCRDVDVEIDWEKNTYYCPSCGTHYVFERSSENQNTYYNTYKIEINTVKEKNPVDKLIRNARFCMIKLRDFDKARCYFEKAIDEAPDDFRGWWGMVLVDNFNMDVRLACNKGVDPYQYETKSKYLKNAFCVASAEQVLKLRKKWCDYETKYREYVANREIEALKIEKEGLENKIEESRHKIDKTIKESTELVYLFLGLGGVLLLVMLLNGNFWNWLLALFGFAVVCVVLYFNMQECIEYFSKDVREKNTKERKKITEYNERLEEIEKRIKELHKK